MFTATLLLPAAPFSASLTASLPPIASPPGRAAVLQNMDTNPPLIVHQAESAGQRFPYDVLFRSAYKLLMDTATSEYLFCQEFWAGDARVFSEIFAASISAIEENLTAQLATSHDVIGLVLMARGRCWVHAGCRVSAAIERRGRINSGTALDEGAGHEDPIPPFPSLFAPPRRRYESTTSTR